MKKLILIALLLSGCASTGKILGKMGESLGRADTSEKNQYDCTETNRLNGQSTYTCR